MSAKIKKRLEKLWTEVNGKCYWCGRDTKKGERGKQVDITDLATVDHLRTRLHQDERKAPNLNNEERTVLACWQCNQIRGILDQKTQSEFTVTEVKNEKNNSNDNV